MSNELEALPVIEISFVKREIERINNLLKEGESRPKYKELYAAQQALSWSIAPEAFRSPYDMITGVDYKVICSGPKQEE